MIARHSELAVVQERLDVVEARNTRLATSLLALVKQLERVQGYSSHAEQAELRAARAVLAEEGK